MLLRFRFSNFRSFKDARELSFVAANKKDDSPGAVYVPEIGERVLNVAALCGANASGKTNVLKALEFFNRAIRDSQSKWSPDEGVPISQFTDTRTSDAESGFCIETVSGGVVYEYGAGFTGSRVSREWLYAFPRGRKQVWFERSGDTFEFGRSLVGENRLTESITRPNSLFLSAARQSNHKMLAGIAWDYWWIVDAGNSSVLEALREIDAKRYRADTLPHLAAADLGIREVRFRESGTKTIAEFLHDIEGTEQIFPNEMESSGTLAFHAVLSHLTSLLEFGGLGLVDELDARLHPLLVRYIVSLLTNPKTNPKRAQLVFTCHSPYLLDPEILRRDSIWFTEKSREGTSRLYSLTDFKPRPDQNLQNAYLQGRYGAIPFIDHESYAGKQ